MQAKLLKVDLACGQLKREGYVGIDIAACAGVDIVADLERFPWPLESDSVDEVYCSHYVEHTGNIIAFMDELYRVLKPPRTDQGRNVVPGGKALIIVPYLRSDRAFQDPTHKNFLCESSFLYYNRQWREAKKLSHYPIQCDFDLEYEYKVAAEWANRPDEILAFAIRHYWNVVGDLHVTLTKR